MSNALVRTNTHTQQLFTSTGHPPNHNHIPKQYKTYARTHTHNHYSPQPDTHQITTTFPITTTPISIPYHIPHHSICGPSAICQMTMMTRNMVAMDLCISNCWGNMLMSMLLGAIMTVIHGTQEEDGRGQGGKNNRNSCWMSSDSCWR